MSSVQFLVSTSRMSQAVVHNGVVYLAGQVADHPVPPTVREQTVQVLEKIDRYLTAVGSSRARILQATIWLSDMSSYMEFNQVWDLWIDPKCPPARACTQARLAHPDWGVEVMLTAAL